MFEILLRIFYMIGIYLITFLLLLKFIVLSIYKPKDWVYIFSHLLIYHHRYVVRREEYTRFLQFRMILNIITFVIHLSLLAWIGSHYVHSAISEADILFP